MANSNVHGILLAVAQYDLDYRGHNCPLLFALSFAIVLSDCNWKTLSVCAILYLDRLLYWKLSSGHSHMMRDWYQRQSQRVIIRLMLSIYRSL